MYDRFPQLRQIPEGTPPNDGFLDGLFFLGHICIAIYVAVGLSLALLLTGLPYAARLLTSCILFGTATAIVVWAIMVPGSLWTMLIPTLAPALLLAFLVYTYTSSANRVAKNFYSNDSGHTDP